MRARLLVPFLLLAAPNAAAHPLAEAIAQAERHHPRLQALERSVESARERLREASAPAYNPELSAESQRRRLIGGGRTNDYYLTLSQGLETGGKRRFRAQAAKQRLEIARQQLAAARLRLAADVARAWVHLAIARRIANLRQQQEAMLQRLRRGMDERLRAGDASRLDLNLTASELMAARQAALDARKTALDAERAWFAASGTQPPAATSALTLPLPDPDWRPPPASIETALQHRPDLNTQRAALAAARADARLASAQRLPDITVNAMIGREAGDKLVKIGISLPLPLLNTHRGAWRAAQNDQERARLELQWAEQNVRQEIAAAIARHESSMQTLAALPPETNALELAREAYESGEIGLDRFIFHARQAIEARITRWRIIEQAWLARIELARALGNKDFITRGIHP